MIRLVFLAVLAIALAAAFWLLRAGGEGGDAARTAAGRPGGATPADATRTDGRPAPAAPAPTERTPVEAGPVETSAAGDDDDDVDTTTSDETFLVLVTDPAGTPRPEVPVRRMDRVELGFSSAWAVGFEGRANDGPYVRIPVPRRGVASLVRPAVVGFRGEDRPIDADRLPTEPVRLVAPPTGAVRVVVVDEEGARRAEPVDVACEWGVSHSPDHLRVRAEGGVARFPFVATVGTVVFHVRDGEARGAVRHDGGRPAGEIELRLVVRRPEELTLVGRLVDVDGTPVAETTCRLDDARWFGYSMTRGTGWPPSFETDAEGRFDAAFVRPGGWLRRPRQEVAPGVWAPWPLEVRPLLGDGRPDPARRATVVLAEVAPVRHDVGTLRLEEEPLFVEGAVVRPDGTPVAGATVEVTVRRDVRPGTILETLGARHDPRAVRIESDAAGRFEVRAAIADLEGMVTATLDGVRSDAVGFRRGRRGLRVELVPEGAAEGRVILDAGVPLDRLVLAFRRPASGGGVARRPVRLDASGRFRAEGLRVGAWSFEVSVPGEEPPVARVDDVVVEAGVTTADARLDPLDARGRVVVHRIEVVDPAGTPCPGATVTRVDLGRTVGHTDVHGALTVVSVRPTVELSVHVDGKRRLEPRVVAGRARFVLD
ncbi:MAG: hypothetical protein ACF8XB_00115 [Planctomycetota bacterium JB042]